MRKKDTIRRQLAADVWQQSAGPYLYHEFSSRAFCFCIQIWERH